ncbi:peptidase S13 [Kroppenstedtia guangzhouensis]|uniref:Peptidase S13 n=1 Tax=Kroppenstedtia guangzhouensis TaxID=1274356 RepID=A0ABQ1G3N5_9BACL|nr:D-alanyl-D-alanine carboxypeptidase/D-alanyl-D-alanine-endopeptidase [Kroppenstedtia guangzhouensis]GGA36007.1 peptidase S13 [Kroppenstedtia guangzhouensis]
MGKLERLKALIDDWSRRSGETGARVGCDLFCFRTGKRWGIDANKGFTPASNQKLWTTLVALDELGPDYRWRTRFAAGSGCLYIRGGGDPSFDESCALRVACELKERGLTRLDEVRLDDGLSSGHPWGKGWMWDDLAHGYGAPIHALIMERNRVTFHFDPVSEPPKIVRVSPRFCQGAAQTMLNWTEKPEAEVEIFRIGAEQFEIKGEISRREPELEAAVAQGPEFFAEVMIGALREKGVIVSEGIRVIRGPFSERADIRMDRVSPTLAEVLHQVNKESDNLTAEVLLRTIGMARRGTLSEEEGLLRVMDWFRKAGLQAPAVIADGSGLSGYNQATPEALLNILIWAYRNDPLFPVWLDSLPRYGRDGTLKNRTAVLPQRVEVAAKTGSLAGVRNLSGYFLNNEGEPLLSFSFLINGLLEEENGEKLQDQFLQLAVTKWVN